MIMTIIQLLRSIAEFVVGTGTFIVKAFTTIPAMFAWLIQCITMVPPYAIAALTAFIGIFVFNKVYQIIP